MGPVQGRGRSLDSGVEVVELLRETQVRREGVKGVRAVLRERPVAVVVRPVARPEEDFSS